MAPTSPTFSVVIPLKDEEQNLEPLAGRLRGVLDGLAEAWEVILVDDGSVDGTYGACVELSREDERFKVVRLSRTFGHQVAISAGLDLASGTATITMDGDLQHPPELIPELVSRWRAGAQIVYAIMAERHGESRFKGFSARWFYATLNYLAEIDVPAGAGDYRLIDRAALDALRQMPERNRYLRGMFSWIGFEQTGVAYASPARFHGRTKYTLGRMVRLATNAVAGFSDRPLRLSLSVGFVVSFASMLFGVFALGAKLAGTFVVPGWTSVMVLVGVVGGVQLVVVGIVGIYVGHIADEVRRRPLYIVRATHGLDDRPPSVG